MRRDLGLKGGALICNPVPKEREIPAAEISGLIAQAQKDADASNVSGKAVTPYLLQRIFELSNGRSLKTNIALIINNARLAAEIAVAEATQTEIG